MQVAPQDSLDSSMQFSPISIGTKCEIVQQFWNLDVHPGNFYDSGLDLDVFFAYYTDQCSVALHDGGRHILVRTHRDVIDIVLHIKRSMSRDAIARILRSKLSTPVPPNGSELVDASIDLAARVLLMMDFGSLQYGFTGRNKLVWKASDTLQEAVAGYFGVPHSLPGSVKLERIFNARNLKRIAGMKIEWTTNLADHLTLVDEEHKVKLFHHASFLNCQSKSGMFPRQLTEETLQTIALLFPQTEKETRQWFKKLSSSQCLDKKALQCGRLRTEHRQIENFEFWHDRLVILKQFFDEAEPNTLSQWWCDRRKGVQWYTFWVAALVLALTVFFGLIQCVEGALQVYKAFSP